MTAPNNAVSLPNMSTNHFLVFGCIAYFDGFNLPHHTRYCFVGHDDPTRKDGKAALLACARSEEAD